MIDTATNTVTASIFVGNDPEGVAVNSDGTQSMLRMPTTTPFR